MYFNKDIQYSLIVSFFHSQLELHRGEIILDKNMNPTSFLHHRSNLPILESINNLAWDRHSVEVSQSQRNEAIEMFLKNNL